MVLHLRSKTLKKRQRVRFSKSVTNNARNCPATSESGGEGGIRTPDTLSGMPVFKTGAINHSATSPVTTVLLQFACFGSHSPYPFSLNSIDYKRWPAPAHRFSRPPVSTTHTSLQPIESTPVDS